MTAPSQPVLEQLHIARSSFIDAFSDVETSVRARLTSHGSVVCSMFSQNIEWLRAIKASPQYSKSRRITAHRLLDDLALLNPIRCDIVHSRLRTVRIDDEICACLINPINDAAPGIMARLVRLDEFDELTQKVLQIARDLAAD